MRGKFYRSEGNREVIRNNEGTSSWNVVWVVEIETNFKKYSHSGEASGCSDSQNVSYALWRSKIQPSSTAQHQWSLLSAGQIQSTSYTYYLYFICR